MNILFFLLPGLVALFIDYMFLGGISGEYANDDMLIWYYILLVIFSGFISLIAYNNSIKIRLVGSSLFGAIVRGAIVTIPMLIDPIGFNKLAGIHAVGPDPFKILFQSFVLISSLVVILLDFISIYVGLYIGILVGKKLN